jgi:hypothetical protein
MMLSFKITEVTGGVLDFVNVGGGKVSSNMFTTWRQRVKQRAVVGWLTHPIYHVQITYES